MDGWSERMSVKWATTDSWKERSVSLREKSWLLKLFGLTKKTDKKTCVFPAVRNTTARGIIFCSIHSFSSRKKRSATLCSCSSINKDRKWKKERRKWSAYWFLLSCLVQTQLVQQVSLPSNLHHNQVDDLPISLLVNLHGNHRLNLHDNHQHSHPSNQHNSHQMCRHDRRDSLVYNQVVNPQCVRRLNHRSNPLSNLHR